MKIFKCISALVLLGATSTTLGQQVWETYNFNSPGEISGWSQYDQGATVSDGNLVLGTGLCSRWYNCGNAVLVLPIDFDRTAGDITVTARVAVPGSFSDFDIFGLYAGGNPGLPGGVSDDGYIFSYRPSDGDEDQGIRIITNTGGSKVDDVNDVRPGLSWSWTDVSARISSDGYLVSSLSNSSRVGAITLINSDHQSGSIAIRSWGTILIDQLTVTYSPAVTDSDGDGVGDDLDLCPDTQTGEAVDANGCGWSQLDSDGDDVLNGIDACPNTTAGATVNAAGCSGIQEVTNACSVDGGRNHGAYVSCTAHAVEQAVLDGLLTEEAGEDIVSAAGQSDVGKKPKGNNKGGNK